MQANVPHDRMVAVCFAGVFYIIYGALALSLVVVVIELIVRCVTSVDKDDPFVSIKRVMPTRLLWLLQYPWH